MAAGSSSVLGRRAAAWISVAEMKSYYIYCEWCSWLLSVAEGESSRVTGGGVLGRAGGEVAAVRHEHGAPGCPGLTGEGGPVVPGHLPPLGV